MTMLMLKELEGLEVLTRQMNKCLMVLMMLLFIFGYHSESQQYSIGKYSTRQYSIDESIYPIIIDNCDANLQYTIPSISTGEKALNRNGQLVVS